MPDAAAIGVRKPAAIEKLRGQARRIETAEGSLGMGGVGEAEGADAAVAPGLEQEPRQRVSAVGGLAQVFCKAAFRSVATAAILIEA